MASSALATTWFVVAVYAPNVGDLRSLQAHQFPTTQACLDAVEIVMKDIKGLIASIEGSLPMRLGPGAPRLIVRCYQKPPAIQD